MKLHLLTMIEVHDAFNLFTIKGLIGCFKLKYRLMIKFKAIKNADVGNLICLYFTKSPITCICICTSLKKILIQTLEKGRIMSSVHSLIKEVRSIVIIFQELEDVKESNQFYLCYKTSTFAIANVQRCFHGSYVNFTKDYCKNLQISCNKGTETYFNSVIFYFSKN